MTPKRASLITQDRAYLIAVLLVAAVAAFRLYDRPQASPASTTPRVTVCAQIQNEARCCHMLPPPPLPSHSPCCAHRLYLAMTGGGWHPTHSGSSSSQRSSVTCARTAVIALRIICLVPGPWHRQHQQRATQGFLRTLRAQSAVILRARTESAASFERLSTHA